MMKNKKAIAPLIATVLLIVIVIAAAAIIIAWVVPWVKEMIGEGTACLDTTGMQIDNDWTCLDEGYLQVKVVRDSKDFELTKLIFKATDADGNSKTLEQTTDLPGVLGEQVYQFTLEDFGFGTEAVITNIAVAPVVKIGEKEKTCDIVSSAVVESCLP